MPAAAAASTPASSSGAGEDAGSATYASVVLPTALALLLCNMDRICLRCAWGLDNWSGTCGTIVLQGCPAGTAGN